MTTEPQEIFFDDEPKSNPWADDDLGYTEFARRLAETILQLSAPNGYVIGLHGRWGSGKSTALNFVRAFITKYRQEELFSADKLLVVDFKPWIISGHDDLVSGFFKVLSGALAGKAEKRKEAAKRWIKRLKPASDPLIKAVAEVGVAAVPGASAAIAAASAVAKHSAGMTVKKWLDDPSLQTAYEQLRKRLAERKTKILVTIDDIDRLSRAEIRTIMQMVKSVGSLPNVVYLLSYDRNIVYDALDELSGSAPDQASYAEKIVQLELELPQPSKSSLMRILGRDLQFILSRFDDNHRWQIALMSGFHRWVAVPRDVVRLANSVKFVLAPIASEVDPQDVLCMEGLRLFENPVFQWVRQNRDFIFGQGRWQYALKEQRAAHAEAFRVSLPSQTAEDTIDVLGGLFPGLAKAMRGKEFSITGDEPYHSIVTRRGVGYQPAFDCYFALFPSTDTVSKMTIDETLQHLSDSEWLQRALESQLAATSSTGASLFGEFLEQLSLAFKGGGHTPTKELLLALFEVGERVLALEKGGDFFSLSPRARLSFLIRDTLEALGADAGSALLEAFQRADSPAFCAEVFVDRGRELDVFPDEGRTRNSPITTDDFEKLGPRLLELIRTHVKDGRIRQAPFFFDIARSWAYLEGDGVVEAWLSTMAAEDPHQLAKIAFGMLSYSQASDGFSYHLRSRPTDAFYSIARLRQAAERHADAAGLSVDERRRIVALRDGLIRVEKQSPADGEASGTEDGDAPPSATPAKKPRRRHPRNGGTVGNS